MRKHKAAYDRKRTGVLLISAVASAALLLLVVAWSTLNGAWFRVENTLDDTVPLSNFETQVTYSFDDFTSEETYTPGTPIPVTTENVNQLKLRVSYHGVSAAYLRVKVYGSFYNTISNTFLPQPEEFWSLSGSANWINSGGYAYYTQRLRACENFTALDDVTVCAALSSLGTISDKQVVTGELYVLVDAVQPDRYPAFWGISSLPFGTATTGASTAE